MEALFGSRREPEGIWQDREIRFDVLGHQLEPRLGETVVESLVRAPHTPRVRCPSAWPARALRLLR